jgi:hypothetical protein
MHLVGIFNAGSVLKLNLPIMLYRRNYSNKEQLIMCRGKSMRTQNSRRGGVYPRPKQQWQRYAGGDKPPPREQPHFNRKIEDNAL